LSFQRELGIKWDLNTRTKFSDQWEWSGTAGDPRIATGSLDLPQLPERVFQGRWDAVSLKPFLAEGVTIAGYCDFCHENKGDVRIISAEDCHSG